MRRSTEVYLAGGLDVGDVAAARPAVARREEVEAAVDLDAPEGRRLGDTPAVGSRRRVDGQILRRTPEVLGGVAGVVGVEGIDGDVAVDHDIVGVEAEAGDRIVEADVGRRRCRCRV